MPSDPSPFPPPDRPPVVPSPDCMRCRHFYITYDPRLPKGCRAYGFKSRDLPCKVVLATSGLPCQFFAAKTKP